MSNKYKHGKYRISIADDKNIQNKVVSITDEEGNDALSIDINGKADKVSSATSGNFAGLDATGNLTDSGKKASDFATAAQGALADTAYQKPQTGIPESDLSSDVQQALQKHFNGWYNTLAELKAAHTATEGDSAYVKDASPATTWSIYVYDSTASSDNFWTDSGTDADTTYVQTFASNQEVNEVHIVNDLNTGGVNNVLSAEQGRNIGNISKGMFDIMKTATFGTPLSIASSLTNKALKNDSSNGGTVTNTGGRIVRYDVSNLVGTEIYIVGSTRCDTEYCVYGFFASSSISNVTPVLLGDVAVGERVILKKVTVPTGAGYLMVSESPDSSIYVATDLVGVVDNGVTEQKIKDGAVTNSKVSSSLYSKISITPSIIEAIRQTLFSDFAESYSTYDGKALKTAETGGVINNTDGAVKRYAVTAGEDVYIVGSTKCDTDYCIYGFFSDGTSITGRAVEMGDVANGEGVIIKRITVPTGAVMLATSEKTGYNISVCRSLGINIADGSISEVKLTNGLQAKINDLPQIKNNVLPKKGLNDEVTILYVGSSWMEDNFSLMRDVCREQGIKANVHNWYKGSATYADLLDNFESSTISLVKQNYDGTNSSVANCSIKNAITTNNYDVIVVANGANASFDITTYGQNERDFIRLIKMYSPQSVLATYKGWVMPSGWNENTRWDLSDSIFKETTKNNGIDILSMTGTALRTFVMSGYGTGDTDSVTGIFRDTAHLSYMLGRYIAACANFAAIITPMYGVTVLGNTLRSTTFNETTYTITDTQAENAQICALSANGDRWHYRDLS